MKVKEFLTYLQKCDPEDEVFMIQYDRGDTMDIAGIRTVNKKTMPYDRNGFVESYISAHGKAVIISDCGDDYIKLLDWLEETGRNYPIRIHSMNVVGRMNMEAICRRNGWKIVE